MEDHAIRRLFLGVNYLASSLSRTTLELGELEKVGRTSAHLRRLYRMVEEASKLLLLFDGFAEAQSAQVQTGSGLLSFPVELQNKILGLCNSSATANLRLTCRSFESHALLMARRSPCVDEDEAHALPYLPHLSDVWFPIDRSAPASSRFAAKVLQMQPAAWPRLTSLSLAYGGTSSTALRGNLHLATNITQLRVHPASRGAGGALASAMPHLVKLQSLVLYWPMGYGPNCRAVASVAAAVSALPALQELHLTGWRCGAEDFATWGAITKSIAQVTQLTMLRLDQWRLQQSHSAAYLHELTGTLARLPALAQLSIRVHEDCALPPLASIDFAAGAELVQTIAACTLLAELELSRLQVDVQDCSHYLAHLVRLEILHLTHLPVSEELGAAEMLRYPNPHTAPPPGAQRTFAHLLAGMTHMRVLTLEEVHLCERAAIPLVLTVVPTLTRLETLTLSAPELGHMALIALAKTAALLPSLHTVNLVRLDDAPYDSVGPLATLNWVAQREVFFDAL